MSVSARRGESGSLNHSQHNSDRCDTIIVLTLFHLSCSSACAASDPEPIALASYFMNVPEGSVWNLNKNI